MSDPHDGLTRELRRVFHRDSPAGSHRTQEELLARVHAGVRRRRARRAAGVGAVVALAAGAVLAVGLPLTQRDAELAASRLPGAAGTESSHASASPADPTLEDVAPRLKLNLGSIQAEPRTVRARAVTASTPEELWVLGDADCVGADCVVIGHSDGEPSAMEFHVGPGKPGADMTMRMAANGEDGWVVSDGELFATHDAASTWELLEAPMRTVDDVVASDSSVFVTGEKDGETVVASAPVEADALADAGLPDELSRTGLASELVVTETVGGERFGFLRQAGGFVTFVAFEETEGWNSYSTADCQQATSLSGTDTALWALCGRAEGVTPMVSADGGLTWDLVEVDLYLGDSPRIAAIDPDRAVISNGLGLWLVSGGQALLGDPPSEGAEAKRYDYLGFVDDSTGFMIDADGALSHSDDGGTTWEPVELP